MTWTTDCAAVIPCLNEAAAVGPLVSEVRRHLPAVLVVDDGSSDQTGPLAEFAGAEVLRHAEPLGKGTALRRGIRRLLDQGFKWAVTLDGDGQHAPADIPALLRCSEQTGADLVVGNRMVAARQMPRVRQFVNRWMSRQLSRAANRELPDSQCGFRLLNLEVWKVLPLSASHFEIESEVLLAYAAAGSRIEFVPIQVIYKSEQSKIHPVRDTLRWFHWWRSVRSGGRPPPDRSPSGAMVAG